MTPEEVAQLGQPGVTVSKRRATRVPWLDRIVGSLFVIIGLFAVLGGAYAGLLLLILGLLPATGWWGRGYRWLFVYRRNPAAFDQTRQVLTQDEVLDETDVTVQRWNWSFWKAVLHLDDRLLLLSRLSGNAQVLMLPAFGLQEADQ